jgi:hypothetical protein
MRGLRINQETHTVSIQCVINRTTHALIWELIPLVAIVEFIVRGCTDYFRERFTKNQVFMQDPDRYFGKMITEYMTKKAESARLHHVR